MPDNKLTSHLTQNTTLTSAIKSWSHSSRIKVARRTQSKLFSRMYVCSPHSFRKCNTRQSHHQRPQPLLRMDGKGARCSVQSQTLARRITATKSLFRWLHQYGVLVVDPAEKVAQRSAISPIPTVLTPREYDEVLLVADRHRRGGKPDARPYALVYLLLTTGIKKSETLGILLEHIELDSPNGPQVFIKYATPANRYKERKLSLPDDWIPAYEEYLAQYHPEEKLFPGRRGAGISIEDISNEAGLTKHLSFDMCRWTCALNDFHAGEEPDKIRQKLGSQRYNGGNCLLN